jgi:hypothetical protein
MRPTTERRRPGLQVLTPECLTTDITELRMRAAGETNPPTKQYLIEYYL